MKTFSIIASVIGLGLTVVPAFLVFAGTISWSTHAILMMVGTVIWFASAPYWMKDKPLSA